MKKNVVLVLLGLALFVFCVKDLEVVRNMTSAVMRVLPGTGVVEPSEGILISAITEAVKDHNADEFPIFTYIVDKKVITNKYTLERHGETLFCYDFKCSYRVKEIPGESYRMGGSVQIVRRGDAWYSY